MKWFCNRKKKKYLVFVLLFLYVTEPLALRVQASGGIYMQEETQEITEIRENSLFAKSAVLMDADSGRVLYEKNGAEVLPMASTTKIMTLLIALESGKTSEVVTVSSYAASMPDVQLNMREGEQYYLKDLLYSLMLESHNDSAVAIAEGVAGSIEAFAQKMNQKAKEIGCENTTFITPNGLDATATMTSRDGMEREVMHSTTAEDLAKILSYCVTKADCKEEFLAITRTPTYTFSDLSGQRTFSCRNHNAFLNMMEGALSGKTGFTGKAGYCYVGALERDGRTFVVALLACGWPNNKTYKWKDTTKLMEYGIENFFYADFEEAAKEIPKSGRIAVSNGQTAGIGETAYAEWEVDDGDKEEKGETTTQDTKERTENADKEGLLLRKDETIEVEWDVEESLAAPVKAGSTVGFVRYLVNGEVYREEELVLKNDINEIDYDWCLEKVLEKYNVF